MDISSFDSPYLISCEDLAGQLEDPKLRIFDCTQRLVKDSKVYVRAEACFKEYAEAHIPGSGYIDIKADLSDPNARWRYMMPEPDTLVAAFARHGVGKGMRVVLYDSNSMMWAARTWWLLRAIGFDNAAVLDGGLQRWRATGESLCDKPCAYQEAKVFTLGRTRNLLVDQDAVLSALEQSDTGVVNALTREQFNGGGIHYGRPGRISGSVCVSARELTDEETGLVKAPAELRRMFAEAGIDPLKPTLCYCGGGIAATLDAFVLSLLGAKNVTVYDASLQEWAMDASLPMESG
jgi:thiosulfate/3-mercaptopyruvate sulfurtransferase